MAYIDFLQTVHTRTPRNYVQRVTEYDKAACATIARRFDHEYWDGDRKYGYGGYKYDGRWVAVAERLAAHYELKPGDRVLDVGCAKGFLLHDLQTAVPGLSVAGLDISHYALDHSIAGVRGRVVQGTAGYLPFADRSFDLVVSVNTLHNLRVAELDLALREIERVGKKNKYICVESYRNEVEKANLLYWQVTCEAFNTPEEWEWWFKQTGYTGDHSFIYFE